MSGDRNVLDASALLAYLNHETGSRRVEASIRHGIVSAVNIAEVSSKLVNRGVAINDVDDIIGALHLNVVPFGPAEAKISNDFIHKGVALADRAFLATCVTHGLVGLTSDRVLKQVGHPSKRPKIELFR